MKDPERIILHPIRMRIIQLIAQQRTMTVASLADTMTDIPRSTIYHHVGILCENHILQIVREQKVRGTYEREYGLNYEQIAVPEERQKSAALSMLLKLYADFSSYFSVPDRDPVRDQLFLTVNTLMLTDEEFDTCKEELFGIIQKYINLEGDQRRRPRMLSLISSPGRIHEA
ncbi:helix-turn-helix domain-containing protein [Hungatella hathewayi]|uniref:helix-turn-helix domain-containing protein n=1 Tax=Hungatella hathewayi TaxID=154046 RepID=UPI003565AE14